LKCSRTKKHLKVLDIFTAFTSSIPNINKPQLIINNNDNNKEVAEMTEENKEGCACNRCCTYPPCPACGEGYMVPFSFKEDVYEKWKCTKCKHLLRKND